MIKTKSLQDFGDMMIGYKKMWNDNALLVNDEKGLEIIKKRREVKKKRKKENLRYQKNTWKCSKNRTVKSAPGWG